MFLCAHAFCIVDKRYNYLEDCHCSSISPLLCFYFCFKCFYLKLKVCKQKLTLRFRSRLVSLRCGHSDNSDNGRSEQFTFPCKITQEDFKGEIQYTDLPNQICFSTNHNMFHAADLQLLRLTVAHRK